MWQNIIKINLSLLILIVCTSLCVAEKCIYTFDAKWCGPCKAISTLLNMDEEAQKTIRQYRGFLKLDVDKFPNLANKWDIRTVPYYVIVDVTESPDGTRATVLSRWTPTGGDRLESLKSFLKKGLTIQQK